MKNRFTPRLLVFLLSVSFAASGWAAAGADEIIPRLDGAYFESTVGHVSLPDSLLTEARARGRSQIKLPDGRVVQITFARQGASHQLKFSASPDADILRWGVALDARADEYFTGLMERLVDGPQQATWAPGITNVMNLRGQKVDMLVKPTLSIYAPFYLSSRNYAVFVKGTWPGKFDFCVTDAQRVKIEFEGPSLVMKLYGGKSPAELVKAHALDAGPPFQPPKWMYGTWRWRDDVYEKTNYYDGTPAKGPFNTDMMEDILMMKAYGIPLSIYWVDRPWGPGRIGYDDFEIDHQRLPNFEATIPWLKEQNIQTFMWIAPFLNGKMATNAIAHHWTLADKGQNPRQGNYPLVDFTNPDGKRDWQDGVAKLLKMGVTGFKLDRSEEDIPESRDFKVFDGRTMRENRNAYPAMYVQATYEVAKKYAREFVCMPRAAYTGSSPYSVFWGGDIAGTPEGLRAEIIAVQRAAVMGYPNWGSDTCGYNQQTMETELCSRWLEFSCFTPIMEVGPTDDRGFWNFHNPPSYDAQLIALWRLYGRLHTRLEDYSFEQAKTAHKTGLPIVRPLFLVEPGTPTAWSNWWTFEYGPDILISPIWKKGQRTQEVYLPAGNKWRNAWNPDKVHDGGQTITVDAAVEQLPIFIRDGSKVELGDLNREWIDAQTAAAKRPDLKALDAGVSDWFERYKAKR